MRKGITAISISIMIVMIILLLGTITISSHNIIQNAKKIVFSLELSNIQEKVDKYMKTAEDNDYPITTETYSLSIASISTSVKTQFDGEVINNNNVTLYELDLSEINISDNEYGNKKTEKDVYVFSKDTGRVYYLEGVKFKGNTYFTLTKELIDINEKNKKEKNDDASSQPISITADSFIIKALSSGDKEVYISNIKAEGKNINVVKYELGIIEKNDAKEYFKTNGKTLINDRLKMSELSDVTIYAENSKGDYAIKHIYNIIPEKFSMSIYPGEMSIEDGLVIYDIPSLKGIDQETAMTSYNQFVWVPVPDMDNFKRTTTYNGTITIPGNGNSYNSFEPHTTNEYTSEKVEYDLMMQSVQKYGGFYIGRYEAGTSQSRGTVTGTTDVLLQKNKPVYNNVAWGTSMTDTSGEIEWQGYKSGIGAVELSRGLYKDRSDIVSTLCYGVQWDAALQFIYKQDPDYPTDSIGKGWYYDNYADGNPSHKTGIDIGNSASNKLKNIYDMAGNVAEWTMERTVNIYRVLRGGMYDRPDSKYHRASYREGYYPYGAYFNFGFRPVLYLK